MSLSSFQEGHSSYPPLLLQPKPTTTTTTTVMVPPPPTIELPLIDLHHLDSTTLREACVGWGLLRLVNHDVPPLLSAELHRLAKQLTSLPFESKQKKLPAAASDDPIAYFWGTPALTQKVANVNWVEGFHVPLANLQNDVTCGDDLGSSFRNLVRAYGNHMARISRSLFEAMAVDLQLDSNQSACYLSESEGIVRVYRYPLCPDNGNYFGMDSHTDSSVLSILNQDEVGGLQFLKDQTWFDVRPVPNTLVVNLGDMMQAVSDDMYRSVEHRVLANGSRERISICYFAFPQEDGVITSSKYRAFTYNEFRARVQEDIRAVGFKIGLDRFRM